MHVKTLIIIIHGLLDDDKVWQIIRLDGRAYFRIHCKSTLLFWVYTLTGAIL